MRDLAEDLKVERYAITRLVQDLVERTLVKRTTSRKDARVRYVSTTPKGDRLIADVDLAVGRSLILEWPGSCANRWRHDRVVENLKHVIEAMTAPSIFDEDPEFDRIYREAEKQEEQSATTSDK